MLLRRADDSTSMAKTAFLPELRAFDRATGEQDIMTRLPQHDLQVIDDTSNAAYAATDNEELQPTRLAPSGWSRRCGLHGTERSAVSEVPLG